MSTNRIAALLLAIPGIAALAHIAGFVLGYYPAIAQHLAHVIR